MTSFWHHYGVTETSLRYHGNLLFVYIYKERKLQLVDQIYLALREKCPYSAWKVSVFGVILVCIFPHSAWIRRDTIQMWEKANENNSEYGHFLRTENVCFREKEADKNKWSIMCFSVMFFEVQDRIFLQLKTFILCQFLFYDVHSSLDERIRTHADTCR